MKIVRINHGEFGRVAEKLLATADRHPLLPLTVSLALAGLIGYVCG